MGRKWSRRSFLRAAAGSLAALGVAPVAAGGRPPSGRTDPAGTLPPRTVGLRTMGGDFRFDPVGLAVRPGDRVTWLNMGDFHTTTAFHPDNGDLLSGEVPLRIPEGAEPWHSGMLGLTAGVEFSHDFRVPGVHDYFCQPHYGFGMVGRVVVLPEDGKESRALDPPPADELNEASREVLPTVASILGPPGRAFEWASRINGLLLLRSHDRDAVAPAEAVERGVREDGELGRLLRAAGAEGHVGSAVAAVAEALRAGRGYEELVGRADAAKDALASARRGAG